MVIGEAKDNIFSFVANVVDSSVPLYKNEVADVNDGISTIFVVGILMAWAFCPDCKYIVWILRIIISLAAADDEKYPAVSGIAILFPLVDVNWIFKLALLKVKSQNVKIDDLTNDVVISCNIGFKYYKMNDFDGYYVSKLSWTNEVPNALGSFHKNAESGGKCWSS